MKFLKPIISAVLFTIFLTNVGFSQEASAINAEQIQPVLKEKQKKCDTVFNGLNFDAKNQTNSWIEAGLSRKYVYRALSNPTSRSQVYNDLKNAKSVYHQRVIVKDYDHVPSLTHEAFQNNAISPKEYYANWYAITDVRYNLPSYRTATFTDTAFLVLLKPGTIIYRVTDTGGEASGFWTLEPPKKLKHVIGGTAVMPEWNGFTKVVSYTVPEGGMYVWKGKAAAQPISQNTLYAASDFMLEGQATQIFINDFLRDASFKAAIVDVTDQYKTW